jgi:hypothetical protein
MHAAHDPGARAPRDCGPAFGRRRDRASPGSALRSASRRGPPCGTMAAMANSRAWRDEPPPDPDQLVLRGILGDARLDPADLRQGGCSC